MRLVLTFLSLLFFCGNAFSADKLSANILFQSGSSSLTEEAKSNLQKLFDQSSESKIEKIDIDAFCASSQIQSTNAQLSLDRATAVYNYLNAVYPDKGNYELRTLQAKNEGNSSDEGCVHVAMYILQRNAPVPRGDMSMALFPEDFKDELKALAEADAEDSYIPDDIAENVHFDVEDIFFYGNSAMYKPSSEESLDKLLNFLRYNSNVKIRLEGHVNGKMGKSYYRKASGTNPEGKDYDSALELSEERAKSVKKFLVDNGINNKRIEAIGMGNKDPLYKRPRNQKENSANRRIQVIILQK